MATKPVTNDFFAAAEAETSALNEGISSISTTLASTGVEVVSGSLVELGEHTWTLPSGASMTGAMALSTSRISLMEFYMFRQNRSDGQGTMDVANFVFGLSDFEIGFKTVDGFRAIPLIDPGTPMRLFYAQRMAVNTEETDQLRAFLTGQGWKARANSAGQKLGEKYADSDDGRIVKREMVWNLQPTGNQTRRHAGGVDVSSFVFTPTYNSDRRKGGYHSIVEAMNTNMNDIGARIANIDANGGTDADKAGARRYANAITGAQRDDTGNIVNRLYGERFSVPVFTTTEFVRNRKGDIVGTDPTEWLITSGATDDNGEPVVAAANNNNITPINVTESGF